jgi:hypothetical protein
MGVTHRWQPTSPEYQETMKYMAMHTYQRALDNLQRLVVCNIYSSWKSSTSLRRVSVLFDFNYHLLMWLFSLQNAHAYLKVPPDALSCHSNCHQEIQWCSVTAHPPHPLLEWLKVCHYSFLEEFNLLRKTRQDIRDKMWARPAIHETMRQWLCIQHAKEEIERCNVEVWCLHTFIVDEDWHFTRVLSSLEESPLYFTVQDFWQRSECNNHRAVNLANASRHKLEATRIGGCACARHGCFVPNSMVDFQKGERCVVLTCLEDAFATFGY